MSTNALTKIDRGMTARQDFAGGEIQKSAETAMGAVMARERALIEAQFLVAERHPRNWMDVRGAILDHCKRPKFAEISRYEKPVGKKKVNGQWVEEFARGFTVRFAETLSQEMGNVKPETQVTYEDDMIRVIRISVTDLERNIPRSREVTIAKAIEKRGKKDFKTGEITPPEGREVISVRTNSYGEPSYLVKATDDELRNKINSEESKTQRDFIYKLCPRDILEECEELIAATLAAEDKRDPEASKKKLLDRFKAAFGLMPSDLETYLGKPARQWDDKDRQALTLLGTAIKDGQTTFDDALRAKYAAPTEDEDAAARDLRLKQQADDQLAAAKAKEDAEKLKPITQADVDKAVEERKAAPLTDEENRKLDAEIAAKEAAPVSKGKLKL